MTKNKKKERVLGEIIAGIVVIVTLVFFIVLGILLTFMPNVIMNGGMTQTQFGGMWLSAGGTVDTQEPIDADGYIAGNRVVLDQAIQDDLLVATNHLSVKNEVGGTLRGIGNMLIVDDEVQGNTMLIGKTVWVKKNARLHGDVTILAQEVIIDGEIDQTVGIAANRVTLNGIFRDTVDIRAEQIQINGESRFSQEARMHAYKITTENGIVGSEYITVGDDEQLLPTQNNNDGAIVTWIWWNLKSLMMWLIVGVLLILYAPKWVHHVAHTMHSQKRDTWKNGILFFLATPTLLLLVAITMIGLPLAAVGGLLYVGILTFGKLFTAMMLGLLLLKSDHETLAENKKTERRLMIQQFILGYVALGVLSIIPFIGTAVGLLASIWGAGGIVYYYRIWRNS